MQLILTAEQCVTFIASNGRGTPALFEPRCLFSTILVDPVSVDAFRFSPVSATGLTGSVTVKCSTFSVFKKHDLLALLPSAIEVETVTPPPTQPDSLVMTRDQSLAFIASNERGDPALFEPRCLYSTGIIDGNTVDAFALSPVSAGGFIDAVAVTCSHSTTLTTGELLTLLPNALLVETVTP